MKRRNFVAGVLLAITIPHAQAQQRSKVYRLAIASPTTPVTEMNEASGHPVQQPLFEELKRLGYVEGRNVVVERYSGEGRTENYPELARRVVSSMPDLIFIVTGRLTRFFKEATATIPIVAVSGDPIAFGLTTSLARPDGNITGVVVDAGKEIEGKRVELLKEMVPGASRLAYITPRAMWESPFGAEARDAAQRAGLSLFAIPSRNPHSGSGVSTRLCGGSRGGRGRAHNARHRRAHHVPAAYRRAGRGSENTHDTLVSPFC